MDPFSTEGELLALHSHFHQGQYPECISFDTSSLSPENALPASVLKLRAQLALGQAGAVLSATQNKKEPELRALHALAEYRSGKAASAVQAIESLVVADGEMKNPTCLAAAGAILAGEGRCEEALAVLGRHEGSLECVALVVQCYLVLNRNDLAVKEVAAAKRWGQDSLLVNLAEAWVGMRLGGEKYQQSFYVFEELAQTTATSSIRSLVSQAVAEMHLGRLDEAQAALEQALKKEPEYADAIANILVLSVVSGKDPKEYIESLKKTQPAHHLLTDLEEKSSLFDKAAAKFSSAKASS